MTAGLSLARAKKCQILTGSFLTGAYRTRSCPCKHYNDCPLTETERNFYRNCSQVIEAKNRNLEEWHKQNG